jgi:hypothetical protein
MVGGNGSRILGSFLSALVILTTLGPGLAFAADIIILREIPPHNVLDAWPPGPAVTVPADQKDLILDLVVGPKQLNDEDFGSVLASPPAGGVNPLTTQDLVQNPIDGSRAGGLGNLPGSGMGSFSSIGGQISGQVNSAVSNGLQGLSNSIEALTGAR